MLFDIGILFSTGKLYFHERNKKKFLLTRYFGNRFASVCDKQLNVFCNYFLLKELKTFLHKFQLNRQTQISTQQANSTIFCKSLFWHLVISMAWLCYAQKVHTFETKPLKLWRLLLSRYNQLCVISLRLEQETLKKCFSMTLYSQLTKNKIQ